MPQDTILRFTQDGEILELPATLEPVAKALERDYPANAIDKILPLLPHYANVTHFSTMTYLIDKKKSYGPNTLREGFCQTLQQIVTFGEKANGSEAQKIFENLNSHIANEGGNPQNRSLQATMTYFSNCVHDAKIVKRYRNNHYKRFCRQVTLKQD